MIQRKYSPLILFVCVIICILFSGCGKVFQYKPIEISGLIIRNKTDVRIDDIKLKVEKTGAVVTCTTIPPDSDFSTEFPLKRYQGNAVDVFWKQNGRAFMSLDLHAEVPDDLDTSLSAIAAVEIDSDGTANARLEQ